VKTKNFWVSLSLFNLSVVTLLGLILRSKMLFELPIIDYNHLLTAHSHFAFGGWVTLALMVLMVNVFLTDSQKGQPIYQVIFWGIFISIWGLLLTLPFVEYLDLANYLSALFFLITYIFSWIFIKDIRKSKVSKTIMLLSVTSVVCLVLSSVATLVLAFLFVSKSLNVALYHDALFSYLHLQYNGFFTLAVFALFFHKLESKLPAEVQMSIFRFSVTLVISILPSMFLSYHWHDYGMLFHIIAISGSILILLSLGWFFIVVKSLLKVYKLVSPVIRFLGVLSLGAFMLKMFLQSFTIIDFVGNIVFGDRSIIMGFLHLVFLGFVTLFLLAYFAQTGFLNIQKTFTKFSLVFFAIGIVFNEILLWSQGIVTLFIKRSDSFPWLLWGAGVWLCIGAILIGVSRIKHMLSSVQEFRSA